MPEEAGALFRLNASEVARIRELTPKHEIYLRRPDEGAVLRLEVDPESYWLYTSSPLDAERRAAAVEEYGLAKALEVLAGPRTPHSPTPRGHDAMRLPITLTLLTLPAAALPAASQQQKEDAAFLRVPAAQESEDRIHTIRARVRHTTVIVLPAGERILDFVAGDSEYWHLTGAANVAYLKPLADDAATNIALVCESGRIYSFLAAEHGEGPPHLVVRVEAGAEAAGMSGAGAPAFVARSEVAAYREMAAEAARAAQGARAAAEAEMAGVSLPPIQNGFGSSTGWTGTRRGGRSLLRRCGTTAGSPTSARAPKKLRRSTSSRTASRRWSRSI